MNKTLGAIFLIAGCCIGAGMLGMPVITGPSGFIPSLVAFILSWQFMLVTGVILLDLYLSVSDKKVNLITLAKTTLGVKGKIITWVLFAFLFYALMTAYVAGSAQLLASFVKDFFGFEISHALACILFTVATYLIITKGVDSVDVWNRRFMYGLFLCYVLLIAFATPHVSTSGLSYSNWGRVPMTFPVLIVTFGYHNLLPSLISYLNRDRKKLIFSIFIGSLIPLIVYVIWQSIIFGLVPVDKMNEWVIANAQGELVTQVLQDVIGNSAVVFISQTFALFAIATSFLPVSLSFLDFLRDGLSNQHRKPKTELLGILVLVPPLLITLIDPSIFLQALGFAGGFCAVILFGILPCVMCWIRNKELKKKGLRFESRPVLIGITSLAICVLLIEIFHEVGVL